MIKAHEKRVVDERDDIADKIEKLRTFIQTNPVYETLSDQERRLLIDQAEAMIRYHRILNDRIKLF